MNYIISIIAPDSLGVLSKLCAEMKLPLTVAARGKGTAVQSMLDLLGIETTEKRLSFLLKSKSADFISAFPGTAL